MVDAQLTKLALDAHRCFRVLSHCDSDTVGDKAPRSLAPSARNRFIRKTESTTVENQQPKMVSVNSFCGFPPPADRDVQKRAVQLCTKSSNRLSWVQKCKTAALSAPLLTGGRKWRCRTTGRDARKSQTSQLPPSRRKYVSPAQCRQSYRSNALRIGGHRLCINSGVEVELGRLLGFRQDPSPRERRL
jgi:hypothetical protein